MFVNILTKEKIVLVSIFETTIFKIWWAKTTIWKHGFIFSPPFKKALDFFEINFVTFENQCFPSNKFYC